MSKHAKVEVDIGSFGVDRSLKKFKRLCDLYGIYREYKSRKEYKKPSIKKKEKQQSSLKRKLKAERKSLRPRKPSQA